MGNGSRCELRDQAHGKRVGVNIPAKHSGTGVRQRRYFETQAEAEGFVRALGVQIENYGLSAQLLKPTEAEQAKAAIRLLEDAGEDIGLLQVVKRYLASERRRRESRPLLEVITAFLASKRRSEKYISSLTRTQTRLKPLHEVMVGDITAEEIEKLLLKTADTYRNSLLREIRAIFAYAV
ncbi:MAG: hypothetical protein JWL59_525 [Chthoniobacteraceae bacterium]|nr:hypothetical protein [Chthoniobacteraceae bacterium]